MLDIEDIIEKIEGYFCQKNFENVEGQFCKMELKEDEGLIL